MMSPTRRSGLPTQGDSMKNVWELRRRAQIPIETGDTLTYKAPPRENASEHTSHQWLAQQHKKQARSFSSPTNKFNYGTQSSHEVGWLVDTPETSFLCRQPPSRHAVVQSANTHFRHKTLKARSEVSLLNRK